MYGTRERACSSNWDAADRGGMRSPQKRNFIGLERRRNGWQCALQALADGAHCAKTAHFALPCPGGSAPTFATAESPPAKAARASSMRCGCFSSNRIKRVPFYLLASGKDCLIHAERLQGSVALARAPVSPVAGSCPYRVAAQRYRNDLSALQDDSHLRRTPTAEDMPGTGFRHRSDGPRRSRRPHSGSGQSRAHRPGRRAPRRCGSPSQRQGSLSTWPAAGCRFHEARLSHPFP